MSEEAGRYEAGAKSGADERLPECSGCEGRFKSESRFLDQLEAARREAEVARAEARRLATEVMLERERAERRGRSASLCRQAALEMVAALEGIELSPAMDARAGAALQKAERGLREAVMETMPSGEVERLVEAIRKRVVAAMGEQSPPALGDLWGVANAAHARLGRLALVIVGAPMSWMDPAVRREMEVALADAALSLFAVMGRLRLLRPGDMLWRRAAQWQPELPQPVETAEEKGGRP